RGLGTSAASLAIKSSGSKIRRHLSAPQCPASRQRALPRLPRYYALMRQVLSLPSAIASASPTGLCRLLSGPAATGTFPALSLRILPPRAWLPPPAALVVHLPASSHEATPFPPLRRRQRQQSSAHTRLRYVSISRVQSFTHVQARGLASHPDPSYCS